LIAKTNSGIYFSYDESNLSQAVFELFEERKKFEFTDTKDFSREKLTKDLSELLNKL